jgi:hypothetical protein
MFDQARRSNLPGANLKPVKVLPGGRNSAGLPDSNVTMAGLRQSRSYELQIAGDRDFMRLHIFTMLIHLSSHM